MRNLFPINRLKYTKVEHYALPAKPSNDEEWKRNYTYTGRGFSGKPCLLNQYLIGGWGFSERRKEEIKALIMGRKQQKLPPILVPENSKFAQFLKLFY